MLLVAAREVWRRGKQGTQLCDSSSPLSRPGTIRSAPLLKKRHLRPLDVHHRLGEPRRSTASRTLTHGTGLLKSCQTSQPPGASASYDLAAVVQHMLQVMPAVDERELQRREPAEVIGHRVGHDEERLVGRAE